MKKQKRNNIIVIIATSAITIPMAFFTPSAALANENNNEEKNIVGYEYKKDNKAVQPTLSFTFPLLSKSVPKEVTASVTAEIDFSREKMTSNPNPQIEIDKQHKIAVAKVEKAKKEAEVKRLKAEATEKALAKKEAQAQEDKEKAEALAESIAQRDDKGYGLTDEDGHFMPSGIEKMTNIDDKLVTIAATGKGMPYVWGGTTPEGWDCSGFVQWTYKQAGIDIPRVNQWTAGTVTKNPVPGDIVVQNGGSHVGIYAGGGMMYSALNPKDGTKFHPVNIMPSYFVHIDR